MTQQDRDKVTEALLDLVLYCERYVKPEVNINQYIANGQSRIRAPHRCL